MKFALSTDEIYQACAQYIFDREGIRPARFNAEWNAANGHDGKPRLTVWIEPEEEKSGPSPAD